MLLVFILGVLSMKPLIALNFTECEQCNFPENFTRMKRYGGGRGGAKARGVLRDDKGGGAAPAPAGGGNATGGGPLGASGGGNDTGGGPPKGVMDGGMPMPPGMGGNGSMPFLPNITFPGNITAQLTADKVDPKQIVMSHFTAVGKDRNCECIFETDEAPNTAVILYRSSGNLLCFGSIVDHCHILTAKRCLNKVEASDLRVVVGCLKAWWGRNAQIMKVKKIMRHELEAALLWLKSEFTFTDFVQPARLPSSTFKGSDLSSLYKGSLYITGFFVEPQNEPGGRIAKDNYYLLKGDKIASKADCKTFYETELVQDADAFCSRGNATYCWGGWGAPVLSWQNYYFIQVGFVIADSCDMNETGPFLVARTDFYAEWINNLVFDFHKPT